MPFGSEEVEIVSAGAAAIVILDAFVTLTVGDSESVTRTVKFAVPEALSMPVIAPVLASSDAQAGSVLIVIARAGGAEIVSEKAFVALAGVGSESVAFTVKLLVLAELVLPLITPVPAFSEKPDGSAPLAMLHL